MGLFNRNKALDCDLAIQARASVGKCKVLGEPRDVTLSHYDMHKKTLLSMLHEFGNDSAIPVMIAFDYASQYPDSVGVFRGREMLGWIIKQDAESVVPVLKKLGTRGEGILGEVVVHLDDDMPNSPSTFMVAYLP